MKGTCGAMSPAMNATSRDWRSSLATITGHLPVLPTARRCELRAPLQGVGALAGLDLGKLGDEHVALGLRKACRGRPLGFDAEA
jgi:hypothetical protein